MEATLPPKAHRDESRGADEFLWLEDRPHLDKIGSYIGRTMGEAIALAIGMSLRDLYDMQFDTATEAFVAKSNMDFSVVDNILIPFCMDMTSFITISGGDSDPTHSQAIVQKAKAGQKVPNDGSSTTDAEDTPDPKHKQLGTQQAKADGKVLDDADEDSSTEASQD
jgi:hypothetical protein